MISKYQKERLNALEARAFELYKEGLSLRIVSARVGKSYEWVRQAVEKSAKALEQPMNTDNIET